MVSRYARSGPEPTSSGRTAAAAAARSSTSSPFSGASRATLTTATSSPSPNAARSSERLAASSSARSDPRRHVDRVREDPDASGSAPSATTDSRASEPTTSTDARRAQDRRHGRRLDGAAPAGLRPRVVALDQQHVRHAAQAAPDEGGLRGERAPARDDDDVRLRLLQRIEDRRRDRVVVADHGPAPGT